MDLKSLLEDVFTAIREGAGANLDVDALELPPTLKRFVAATLAAVAPEASMRAQRQPAAIAFFGERPATLVYARKVYQDRLGALATQDLRWLVHALRATFERDHQQPCTGAPESLWDVAVGPPARIEELPGIAAEAALVLALLDLVLGEIARRGEGLEAPAAPEVVATTWRDGEAHAVTADDEARAKRTEALIVASLFGIAVCAVEVWLLTMTLSDRYVMVGRRRHYEMAPALMGAFPATVVGGMVGALAGHALYLTSLLPGVQQALARWRGRLPAMASGDRSHPHARHSVFVPSSLGGGWMLSAGRRPVSLPALLFAVVAGAVMLASGFVVRHRGAIALGVAVAALAGWWWARGRGAQAQRSSDAR